MECQKLQPALDFIARKIFCITNCTCVGNRIVDRILIVDSILFVPCKVSVLFLMLCAALFFKGHVYDGKVKPLPGFLTLSHKS
jgi:hypothetical protein